MSDSSPSSTATSLAWLPYHQEIVDHLKQVDPHVWSWFSRSTSDVKTGEDIRFELLKSTYRIDRESQPSLYETAQVVKDRLGIDAPVTIYQAQHPEGLNASLAYLPDEIHMVLHGPIAEKMTPTEMLALFGHEMAHFLLWHGGRHELFVAFEMLRALTNDSRAHPAHFASWRLLRLHDEIYCDRASYLVTGDPHSVISMLVKVQTGVLDVNPDSYLRQADEIFAHGPFSTTGITHPETFIRARAIRLWAERQADVDAKCATCWKVHPDIDELDLLAQLQLSSATRRLLDALLCHKWFQTDVILAHARLYFEDYTAPTVELKDDTLVRHVRIEPDSLRDYFCFVLLDFASTDRDLDEAALAVALMLSEQLQIKSRFLELARKELRLRKNQIEKIDLAKEASLRPAISDTRKPQQQASLKITRFMCVLGERIALRRKSASTAAISRLVKMTDASICHSVA